MTFTVYDKDFTLQFTTYLLIEDIFLHTKSL